jgi:RNA polymerase sigma-70 factor (ECF subfamily)
MATDPLDALLAKLCSGDAAAAEQVFRTYEPYLRMVVRRLLPKRLRSKFDSIDIVQSVWADLWRGFQEAGWHFENAVQFRTFLIKMTRNRFIDRLRRHRGALKHERPWEHVSQEVPRATREPQPGEVAQAEELWDELLALCPPAHHQLLTLKRQGLPLAEIASRTGLHESSVRRVLYDLARRLATKRNSSALPFGPSG